jgi:hypothetical protein
LGEGFEHTKSPISGGTQPKHRNAEFDFLVFLESFYVRLEKNAMRIAVTCYAGYRGEETPRQIRIGTNTVAVTTVRDRWLSPDHRYFKILGEDGAEYIVRHDVIEDVWELVLYRHPDTPTHVPGGSIKI